MNTHAHIASSLLCQGRPRRRSLFAEVAAATLAGNATGFHSGMHLPAPERSLAKDQMLALPAVDTRLVCLEGELWLTRDGDIEDYILGPGQGFDARRGDKLTVQALRPSRVRLDAV